MQANSQNIVTSTSHSFGPAPGLNGRASSNATPGDSVSQSRSAAQHGPHQVPLHSAPLPINTTIEQQPAAHSTAAPIPLQLPAPSHHGSILPPDRSQRQLQPRTEQQPPQQQRDIEQLQQQGPEQRATQNGQATAFQPLQPAYGIPNPPVVFYPAQAGVPALMSRCPRCGLTAGTPYEPYPHMVPVLQQQQQQRHQQQQTYPPHYYSSRVLSVAQHQPTSSAQSPSNFPPSYPQPQTSQDNRNNWAPDARLQPPSYSNASRNVTPPLQPIPQSYSLSAPKPDSLRTERLKDSNNRINALALARDQHNAEHPDEFLVRNADGTTRARKRKSTDLPYRRRLTRDERRDIMLMRRLGYKYEDIARFLGTTIRSVSYTMTAGTAEVKSYHAGRKPKAPPEKIEVMVRYVDQYLHKERSAGLDKRGKKKVPQLTYTMIRDAVLKDPETGEIPSLWHMNDEMIKSILNKRGLRLRAPWPQAKKAEGRVRGKRQWAEQQEKARLAAQKAAAESGEGNETESGNGLAAQNSNDTALSSIQASATGYAEASGDEDMEDDNSRTESISDSDESSEDEAEDMHVEAQLLRAIEQHPVQDS